MLSLSGIVKGYALLLIVLVLPVALPAARASAELDEILTTRYPFQRSVLEKAYQYKLNRGAANLSSASCLLIRAGDRALREGRSEEAALYAEYALKLAPAYPPAHLNAARVAWTQERYRLDKLVAGLYRYLQVTVTRYVPAVFFLSSALLIFLLAALLTVGVFSLLSLYRYFKLFIHDVAHLLPIPVPRHLSFCCGLIILAFPLFFKWSLFIIFFYWLFLLFVYHSRREQQIVIIFTFFLMLSPFLLQILSQLTVTTTSAVFYPVYQVNEDNWDEETTRVLSAWLSTHPHDADVISALGLIKKREGGIEEAQRLYKLLLETDPLNCRAWCNLGNSVLAADKPDAAILHYSRSLELCPGSADGYYNLSRVQLMQYMFPESNRSFNKAKELDPDRINQFLQIYAEHPNRLVVDLTIPPREFWQKTFTASEEKENFTAYLWGRFFFGIPYKYRYSVAFVCLLFIVLLFAGRSRSERAVACEYCGCAVCKKCKRLVLEHNLCKQCASIFKGKKDLLISIASKESQAGAIERFHGRQIVISKLLAFLLPGSGQLLFDYPLRGVAILFCFFFFVLIATGGAELIVNPFVIMPSYMSTAISLVALIILYVYALVNFNACSIKLAQFLSLIRVTRKEFQIKA